MCDEGKDPAKFLSKFTSDKPEDWGDAEQKVIKTLVRTGSGRMVEKTVFLSKEDYEAVQKLTKAGKNVSDILSKYVALGEGEKLHGWEKSEASGKKAVKTTIRTKSGRLVERTVLLTADEYARFQQSGGDANELRKYMTDLDSGDVIEAVNDKASTVYSASDDDRAPGID